MPAASLFALIDDIASVLDDVAAMTKVAAKKTAGVLGDDLALNAQQVSGVHADRELPVVWAVARGSLMNKAILVPAALAISALAPWAVTPLLMVGGAYLCFEGAEKLLHGYLPHDDEAGHGDVADHPVANGVADPAAVPAAIPAAGAQPAAALPAPADPAQTERDKVRGAIRTDFVLSAEIIAITLGTVAQSPWQSQLVVLVLVALLMTAGVYGFVAAIVKLDDLGLWLSLRTGASAGKQLARRLGAGLLVAAPQLMKALSVVGTAAVFLVGGGILGHGWHGWQGITAALAVPVAAWPVLGPALAWLLPLLADALLGFVAGCIVVGVVQLVQRLRR